MATVIEKSVLGKSIHGLLGLALLLVVYVSIDTASAGQTPQLCQGLFSQSQALAQALTGHLPGVHLRSEYAIHRYVYTEFVAKNDLLFPAGLDEFTSLVTTVAAETGLHPFHDYDKYIRFKELPAETRTRIAQSYYRAVVGLQSLSAMDFTYRNAKKEQIKGQVLQEKLARLESLYNSGLAGQRAVLDVIETHFPYHFAAWSHHSGMTYSRARDPLYLPILATSYLAATYAFDSGLAGVFASAQAIGAYAIGKLALGKIGVKWRAHRLVRSVKRVFSNVTKEEQAETNWAEWLDERSRLQKETARAVHNLESSTANANTNAISDGLIASSYRLLNSANIVEAINAVDLEDIKILKKTYAVSPELSEKAKRDLEIQLATIDQRLEVVISEVEEVKLALGRLIMVHDLLPHEGPWGSTDAILRNQIMAADQVLLQVELARIVVQDLAVANSVYSHR